jgi:hypothetical protein
MTCGTGYATLLLARWVPDRVIMEALGHAEIGVTMNTYVHVLPVRRQERPTPCTSCSGRYVSGFGYRIGYSKGRFMIGSSLRSLESVRPVCRNPVSTGQRAPRCPGWAP